LAEPGPFDSDVFNIRDGKYRLIAAIALKPALLWVKAVLTHAQYDCRFNSSTP